MLAREPGVRRRRPRLGGSQVTKGIRAELETGRVSDLGATGKAGW